MKLYVILLLLPLAGNAQKVEPIFYDWKWKPTTAALARFVSLTKKTDSGWYRNDYYLADNRPQMRGLFSDSACKQKNGFFSYYYPNGVLSSKGNYSNNKKQGLWLSYHNNGMMKDSTMFINGKATGISIGWYADGYMSDSVHIGDDGIAVKVDWFNNGNISSAGRLINDKKAGKWVFYHSNGNKSAEEDYENDKLQSALYFTEDGKQTATPVYETAEAQFNGGTEKWRQYLGRKLMFPPGYKLVNTDIVTVVVNALVDENGDVKDVYTEIPFQKPFDEEALRAVKKSPKWIPATNHNRRVPMYIRQPVSFGQQEE
jgi:antitoxin component YwqK of YwqJK toxin-antitoxin module